MKIREFYPVDLKSIELQPQVIGYADAINQPGMGDTLMRAGQVFTGVVDDKVIAIVGYIENKWNNSATGWALFSYDSGPHMRPILRAVKAWLDIQDFNRVEVTVDIGFPQGNKLARLLGFELEGRKRRSTRDGRDEFLYSFIKDS